MTALLALNVVLWACVLALLVPPLWRSVRRCPRSLDSLWVVCLIGVCNRLALAMVAVPPMLATIASALLALLFGTVVWSYQRDDRS